jgi:hypothetical protein
MPAALLRIAAAIASVSKPWCAQNLLSSAAITARTMLRSIRSIGIHSRVAPLPSNSWVSVRGGAAKR